MLSCRTDGISEALSPRDYLLYFFGFMRAVQGKGASRGGTSGFKGQERGGFSWLLYNKKSGGQYTGLSGVTGLKEHTILKASGYRVTTSQDLFQVFGCFLCLLICSSLLVELKRKYFHFR